MSCRSPRTVPMSRRPVALVSAPPLALSSGQSTPMPAFGRAGGDEHLGHTAEDVVLKILADDAHAGDEALLGEDLLRGGGPRRRPQLGHLLDFLGFALVDALGFVNA